MTVERVVRWSAWSSIVELHTWTRVWHTSRGLRVDLEWLWLIWVVDVLMGVVGRRSILSMRGTMMWESTSVHVVHPHPRSHVTHVMLVHTHTHAVHRWSRVVQIAHRRLERHV